MSKHTSSERIVKQKLPFQNERISKAPYLYVFLFRTYNKTFLFYPSPCRCRVQMTGQKQKTKQKIASLKDLHTDRIFALYAGARKTVTWKLAPPKKLFVPTFSRLHLFLNVSSAAWPISITWNCICVYWL